MSTVQILSVDKFHVLEKGTGLPGRLEGEEFNYFQLWAWHLVQAICGATMTPVVIIGVAYINK
jgi:hypothetical protein